MNLFFELSIYLIVVNDAQILRDLKALFSSYRSVVPIFLAVILILIRLWDSFELLLYFQSEDTH